MSLPESFGFAELLALVALTAAVAGCDMGSRDSGPGPQGDGGDTDSDDMDAGDGTDTDTDTDTDTETDTDTDTSDDLEPWQTEDAGDHWDDGTITVEGPCGNDCQYVYDISSSGFGSAGSSYFNVRTGDGVAVAHGVDSARFIFYVNMTTGSLSLYRQRLLSDFNLDPVTLKFIDGVAYQSNTYAETIRTKTYSFSYDSTLGEFTYTIGFNGRHWTKTLKSDISPLIMFNYREYPMETWGPESMLFAYLLGKSYDWDAGGIQEIPIFSPEFERLYTVEVERDEGDDLKLVLRFPIDSVEPLQMDYDSPIIYGDNYEMTFVYEYDIPTRVRGLHKNTWKPYSQPPFEISLPEFDASVEASEPELPTGFTTEPVSFTDGDITLAGEIDDPEAANPHPVVILLPGWDSRSRLGEIGAMNMYSQLGARLAEAGYLAVRLDARGTGESTGDLSVATVDELAGDVQTVVDSLGLLEQADTTRVFLLAMDSGAHVAAKAARDSGAKVSGLILIAPFSRSFREWADDNYKHFLTNAGFLLTEGMTAADLDKEAKDMTDRIESIEEETYEGDTWRGHSPAAWKTMFDLDLVGDASGLPPCFIAVGTENHLILPSMAKDLYDAIQALSPGDETVLCELEGLTHGLTRGTAMGMWPEHGSMEAIDDEAILEIVTWLDERTGGAK